MATNPGATPLGEGGAGGLPPRPPGAVAPRSSPAAGAGPPVEDASLGELFGRLGEDLGLLVRQEVELARAEITREVATAGKGAGMLGGSGITGLLALLLLSLAAAWGLAAAIPTGLAFLVIGLIYAAVAGVLFLRGREELRRVHPVPEQTVETVKEDLRWARHPKS